MFTFDLTETIYINPKFVTKEFLHNKGKEIIAFHEKHGGAVEIKKLTLEQNDKICGIKQIVNNDKIVCIKFDFVVNIEIQTYYDYDFESFVDHVFDEIDQYNYDVDNFDYSDSNDFEFKLHGTTLLLTKTVTYETEEEFEDFMENNSEAVHKATKYLFGVDFDYLWFLFKNTTYGVYYTYDKSIFEIHIVDEPEVRSDMIELVI